MGVPAMKTMNQMNQMKHSTGCRAVFEKLAKFFCFYQCKTRFHVHFASSGSSISLYEQFERVLGVVYTYLMNQMNIDEEGLYKANFENCLFWRVI